MLPPPREFCTGYRFENVTCSKGTDNEWFVSVLSLKKEAICGHERGTYHGGQNLTHHQGLLDMQSALKLQMQAHF